MFHCSHIISSSNWNVSRLSLRLCKCSVFSFIYYSLLYNPKEPSFSCSAKPARNGAPLSPWHNQITNSFCPFHPPSEGITCARMHTSSSSSSSSSFVPYLKREEGGDSCIEGFVHAVSSLGHFLGLFCMTSKSTCKADQVLVKFVSNM